MVAVKCLRVFVTSVALSAFIVAGAGGAFDQVLQPFDHLECSPIRKDSFRRRRWTVDVLPRRSDLRSQLNGCHVTGKAKFFCAASREMNVSPESLVVPAGPEAADFLCYKLQCEQPAARSLRVSDEFGDHEITVKKFNWYCTPVSGSFGTTTTTTSTTTTSTVTYCWLAKGCKEEDYCKLPPMTCWGTGECASRPANCAAEWRPVCGCDGANYSSPCQAQAAGVSVDYYDLCDGRAPYIASFESGPVPWPDEDYCLPWLAREPDSGFAPPEMDVELKNRRLYVTHRTLADCCSGPRLQPSVWVTNQGLRLEEGSLRPYRPCMCQCAYVTRTDIANAPIGEYAMEVCWEDWPGGWKCSLVPVRDAVIW